MVFASRGCPVNCSFCVVPRLEGTAFTLDWEFQPAPILCDNNLSALPVAFQEHIIRRYQEAGAPLQDANSGFEPRTFDEETYQRWRPVLRGPWRFAFDELGEADDVRRMMGILAGERPRRKRVYVLIGNEPIAACYERVRRVLACGGFHTVSLCCPSTGWASRPSFARASTGPTSAAGTSAAGPTVSSGARWTSGTTATGRVKSRRFGM